MEGGEYDEQREDSFRELIVSTILLIRERRWREQSKKRRFGFWVETRVGEEGTQ